VFEHGEIIFREQEESDYLYYIVSGSMDVLRNGELISSIGPDELFLGEMSFLLSNARSATVKARGTCVLIPVSKHAFVNIIKQQPYYGIFLARLLAGRLERLNATVAQLQIDRRSSV
jgi:CRP-like cAMP-binding protein